MYMEKQLFIALQEFVDGVETSGCQVSMASIGVWQIQK